MANIYKASTVLRNVRFRPDSANEPQEVTSTVTLPAGTVLGVGDILAFAILGENVQLTQFTLDNPGIDTNATSTFQASFGGVNYAGAGQTQTWTGTGIGASALLAAALAPWRSSGTQGGATTIARLDGENTAADSFATTPYVVQPAQQILFLTVTAAAATNGLSATVPTNLTAMFKYQYAYADQFVSGVTGVSPANLLGTKVVSPAVTYQYGFISNPNAP